MSSIIRSQAADIPSNMTTTGFDVPGFRIVDNLGVVRGVVVRSRSVFGTVGAAVQTMFGGNISLFTELAERTRKQAFDTMLVQAHMAGADAFFFSSRRRHTICGRDWSSDVCSSDLVSARGSAYHPTRTSTCSRRGKPP